MSIQDIIEGKNDHHKVEALFKAFARALKEMPGIALVRGAGLMLGAKPQAAAPGEIAARCAENGLLILTAKDVLRLLPPLTVTKEEADRGLSILSDALRSFQ